MPGSVYFYHYGWFLIFFIYIKVCEYCIILNVQMILENPPNEFSSQSVKVHHDTISNISDDHGQLNQDGTFFIARVRPLKSLKFYSQQPKETAALVHLYHSF